MGLQFAKVETGDMSQVPPDAPEGCWEAVCKASLKLTSKESLPMIVLDWSLVAALTEGNEDHIGSRVSDFIVFTPPTHVASKMNRRRLNEVAMALEITVPARTSYATEEDFAELLEALNGARCKLWTFHQADKETGENRTKIRYKARPGEVENAAE